MQNLNKPLVTVLMSVFNAEDYLQEAIESVLSQTFSDFEFLVIDDCSTDRSKEILEKISDKRVKLLFNDKNIGLTCSLNKGIAYAKGKYIARMDADDICLPERLKKQIGYMELHPEIGVCGSWIQILNTENVWKSAERNEAILVNMLFYNDIYHPTAVIKSELFEKIKYNEDLKTAQDYYLWAELSEYTKFFNIQEVLLYRRLHEKSISNQHLENQINNANLARQNFFKKIYVLFDKEKFRRKERRWFVSILKNNKKYKIYNKKLLRVKINYYCPNILSRLKLKLKKLT